MANPTDRMIGGANRWTNFVREWADKHSISYGCALSKPEMREAYKAKYGNRKRLTQTKEKELMGQEDKDAPEKPKPPKKKRGVRLIIEEEEEEEEQPKKKGRPKKYATAEEARQAKIKNTIEARKRKKSGQNVVLSEAKEAEMMGKEDVNVARKKVMRPPSGPPPISSATVQAVKAKKDYTKFSPFQGTPQMGMFEAFVERSKPKVPNSTFLEDFIKKNEKFRGTREDGIIQEQYELIKDMTWGFDDAKLIKDRDFVKEYLTQGRGVADTDESKEYFVGRVLRLFTLDADATPIKAILKTDVGRETIDKIKILQDYREKLKSGRGFNPLPEFAEQVEGAESGGGIEYLPDGCVLYTGGGIFGKKFDRFVKKTIGKKATKTIYKALDKTVKPLVNRGIDVGINALGAVQPELIPALQVGKKVLKGYIDRPTAYQENPTKELVKDINPVGLAVDYALGSGMEGGHWTPQMKPYLERELRNYQNIVHHLGQHLSDSGQKDPKDAMGFNHYGNEMRRVQKLLSTI